MNDPDENGWAQVHHCAFRGYLKSLERCVEGDPSTLELETSDSLRQTPFLLAVSSGIQDTVAALIAMGAKVNVINTQNLGAVEICALKGYISILRYLESLSLADLPVWKNLLKMLLSDTEEEVVSAGQCLFTLTERTDDLGMSVISPSWQTFYDNGGVPAVVKLVKNTIEDDAKIPAVKALLNVLEKQEVQDQLVSSGGIPAFIHLLRSASPQAVQISSEVIRDLAKQADISELLVHNQVLPNLLKVLHSINDPDVLVPAVQAIGNVANCSSKLRNTVGSVQGFIAAMVSLFEQKNAGLLLALINAVANIAEGDESNQSTLVMEGIAQQIVNVMKTHLRSREIQVSAVEAVHRIAEGNELCQQSLKSQGVVELLMQMLKKTRIEALLEKTATALWSLAGENIDEKRKMAKWIDVPMLIEFLNSASESINFIGSEGLGVLAQGPINQQSKIGKANGIPSLVRLMKSQHEFIVLSVIRTIRHLCVGVACVPHRENQISISQAQGIKFLVALMVHSSNEMVQVEAAYTLGSVSMGNKAILGEIFRNSDFSYVRILRMLYSSQPLVRLLAGSALVAFAFNNMGQQREIAQQGGVRFNCFVPFLQSDNEYYRCVSAFQVVILARIIPDEEQAKSSAVGIKLLIDLLQDSQNDTILALAADHVASLGHTRAGVPAAIVAINGVDFLCDLLLSKTIQVSGNAAIALGYLTHNPMGERKILHRCRLDPYMMRVIKNYNKEFMLSATFLEGWQHYRSVGLPSIQNGRLSLVRASKAEDFRPLTIISIDDSGSNFQVSSINLYEDNNQKVTSGAHS
ncbi:unnamed protein product [Lymnaea stagnalis]|uniref:Ankyrin and armadillo repeat-containing protein n=1 Tax=Lymnaea stagnalis TaxID=6523 RepID=A0AAV2I3J9_LYMST